MFAKWVENNTKWRFPSRIAGDIREIGVNRDMADGLQRGDGCPWQGRGGERRTPEAEVGRVNPGPLELPRSIARISLRQRVSVSPPSYRSLCHDCKFNGNFSGNGTLIYVKRGDVISIPYFMRKRLSR